MNNLILKLTLTLLLTRSSYSFYIPSNVETASFQTNHKHNINKKKLTNIKRLQTIRSAQITLDGTDIRGPITPLGNFVLVRSKETLSATEGGILLPDQVNVQFLCFNVSLFHCFIV